MHSIPFEPSQAERGHNNIVDALNIVWCVRLRRKKGSNKSSFLQDDVTLWTK